MTEPTLHDPGNTAKIERLYAFMSVDEMGFNGIVAEILPGLGSTPLVTGSRKAAHALIPLAQSVARRSGKTVALFVFKREGECWRSE